MVAARLDTAKLRKKRISRSVRLKLRPRCGTPTEILSRKEQSETFLQFQYNINEAVSEPRIPTGTSVCEHLI